MKKKYPEEEYPLYEIVIDDYDNTGIRLLSIVAEPAIEMMGMAFDNDQKVREFEFKEVKDKQMIVGPAMIPDKKIMRKDDDGNPYMVVFSKETISQMVSKFNANGSNRRINVDHSKQMVNAFVMENWIVEDPYYDKAKLYGFDVPVGTWMVCVKVEDDDFWKEEVRGSGKYGFSIEGLMGQKASKMSKEEFKIEKFVDDLSEDEILEMFNSVAREADESFVLEFMTEKGRRLSGTQKFVEVGDITIPQPQMYWTYVGPNDDKTRPFCKHMLELDKYWTDDDLNEMTDRLGYDFQQYFGSYNCRHTLKRVFITGKPSEPTKGEKKSLVNDQRESGLLGFMKEFTKRRECFGCPPSGDGKNRDGSDDRRCRKKGEGDTGAATVGIKDIKNPPLKASPTPRSIDVGIKNPPLKPKNTISGGHIINERSKDILDKSTAWNSNGDSVHVPISKDEMKSIEDTISNAKVDHKPYWGDKDQTRVKGPAYHLWPKDKYGNQQISEVYVTGGKLRVDNGAIGFINKDKNTFRLNDSKNSRGNMSSSRAMDLFTGNIKSKK